MNPEPRQPQSTRAPRFALRLPLRYRPAGTAVWREGRNENISRSGLLFRTEHSIETDTPIEMMLTLRGGLVENAPGMVICHGRIVRIEPGSENDPRPAVAATIARYRLVRADGNDPRRI